MLIDGKQIRDGSIALTKLADEVSTGGGGVDPAQHAALRTLVHWAANGPFESYSGAFLETLPAGALLPTSFTWWSDAQKTTRLMDEQVTWGENLQVLTSTLRLYDADGTTVLVTATDTMSYEGFIEVSRTRVIA